MLKRLLKTVSVYLLFWIVLGGHVFATGTEQQQGRGSSVSGVITGVLKDKEQESPLMYASIVVHSVADSAMVAGAISDEDGRFVIEDLSTGNYYLVINYVGYPRQEVNDIRITPRSEVHDTGTIYITPDTSVLSEVTVEATRELMEVGLDRRVFNVAQELTAVGGSALDLMQNIPSVAVDFDGNVSLRGSDNVTILIDGRPSGLLGLTGSEALEQLPSDMVERVEVITNPSVRYDPDGTSGIINIVMKKERERGYNGMVSLNASTGERYTGSLNVNYHTGNVNLFANYSGRMFNMDGSGESYRASFLSDTTYLDQFSGFENEMDAHNFTIGVDYSLNDRHTLTSSFGYNTRDRNSFSETDYLSMDRDYHTTEDFFRETYNYTDHGGYQVNLSHRMEFDQDFREWTTDLVYSTRSMNSTQENEQFYRMTLKGDPDDVFQNTYREGGMQMIRLQTDYIHPLGAESKLEFGGQFFMRERDHDFLFFDYDHESGSWVNNEGLSNHFIHNELRYSGYGIYSSVLGNYSLQAGLRFEQANISVTQHTMDEEFKNDYFSLFPSLHLRRNIDNSQSVQISYSRRISRPRGQQLNPFPSYNDPYDISSGNPQLNPQYTSSVELGYARYGDRTTWNPGIFYRYTDGMITRFRTMDDDGIAYTTFENLNNSTSLGGELAFNHRMFDFWRINGTLSYFYRRVEGGSAQMEMQNESYSWSTRMVNNFTFPGGWSAQLTGNYRSPIVMIQGEMKDMYMADVAVRKNVLNNSGTITLRLSDIFNTMNFRMYNYGDNFALDSQRRRTSRMLHIGFTYRINEYERRERQRDPDLDDNGGDMMDFDEFEL